MGATRERVNGAVVLCSVIVLVCTCTCIYSPLVIIQLDSTATEDGGKWSLRTCSGEPQSLPRTTTHKVTLTRLNETFSREKEEKAIVPSKDELAIAVPLVPSQSESVTDKWRPVRAREEVAQVPPMMLLSTIAAALVPSA